MNYHKQETYGMYRTAMTMARTRVQILGHI
jgi:hypothetical protein